MGNWWHYAIYSIREVRNVNGWGSGASEPRLARSAPFSPPEGYTLFSSLSSPVFEGRTRPSIDPNVGTPTSTRSRKPLAGGWRAGRWEFANVRREKRAGAFLSKVNLPAPAFFPGELPTVTGRGGSTFFDKTFDPRFSDHSTPPGGIDLLHDRKSESSAGFVEKGVRRFPTPCSPSPSVTHLLIPYQSPPEGTNQHHLFLASITIPAGGSLSSSLEARGWGFRGTPSGDPRAGAKLQGGAKTRPAGRRGSAQNGCEYARTERRNPCAVYRKGDEYAFQNRVRTTRDQPHESAGPRGRTRGRPTAAKATTGELRIQGERAASPLGEVLASYRC